MTCCAGRAFRGRGAADDGLLARPERPNRCTFPITALRVTFPSSAAIWLAESPPSQSFFSCSTRSSVQVNTVIALFPFVSRRPFSKRLATEISSNPCGQNPLALAGRIKRARAFTPNTGTGRGLEPPHEMSYPTAVKLQYGVTPAQESAPVRPHVPSFKHCNLIFQRHRKTTGFGRHCVT